MQAWVRRGVRSGLSTVAWVAIRGFPTGDGFSWVFPPDGGFHVSPPGDACGRLETALSCCLLGN